MFFNDEEKYTYATHSNRTVIKNLAGDDVAIINSEEKLSFVSGTTPLVKQEVKDFLDKNDIAYFL